MQKGDPHPRVAISFDQLRRSPEERGLQKKQSKIGKRPFQP